MSNEYFDLTLNGVGFANRFRKNQPTGGKPYFSVTIAALRGKSDDEGKVAKTYIDCNFVGNAVEMAKEIAPYFEDDKDPTVMIKFVASDLELKTFEYSSGKRKGERGTTLKGRLYDVKWFKVDGKTFYSEAERLRHEAQSQSETDSNESQAQDDQQEALASHQPEQQKAVDNQDLPSEVKLVKDDPYFDERKQQLKDQGYRWNTDKALWVLPETAAA